MKKKMKMKMIKNICIFYKRRESLKKSYQDLLLENKKNIQDKDYL